MEASNLKDSEGIKGQRKSCDVAIPLEQGSKSDVAWQEARREEVLPALSSEFHELENPPFMQDDSCM